MAPYAGNSKPFARASLILIGLAWTLPFLQPHHRFPLTGFYSEWLAFALGLAAALWLASREPWREAALPAVAIAPIGLAALLGLQAALGRVPYPEQALTAVLYLLWATLLILLGHALRRALTLRGVAAVLAWFLLTGGVLSALTGLVQHFHVSTPLDFLTARNFARQAYGNVGQPNHHAAYLSFALVSAVYLYSRRNLHGALAAGGGALFLLTLALTASRSPWIYLGVFTLMAWLLHRLRPGADSHRLAVVSLWLLPGLMLAQAVAGLPFMASSGDPANTALERLFQFASGIDSRLQLWGEAWRMFLGAPVLGAGFGQFTWNHFVAQSESGSDATTGVYNHAHNIVLHLMAETGLTGALIIVGAVVLWAVDLKKVDFDLEWWWLIALAAVIGIHSLLEYPLWYAHFLGMAALLLGLGAERALALRFAGAARAVAGLAIAAGWLNLIAMLPAYREFEQLVFTPQSRSAQRLDEEGFAKAVVSLYREPLLVPYVELAIAYGVTVNAERLPQKLALTDRAVHFAPVPDVAYRYALLLALAGQREAALRQLERSLRVYPEGARDIAMQLKPLARDRPGEFLPLLELANASRSHPRAQLR